MKWKHIPNSHLAIDTAIVKSHNLGDNKAIDGLSLEILENEAYLYITISTRALYHLNSIKGQLDITMDKLEPFCVQTL